MHRLKICFDSDWHIGSGEGIPGSTDRTVLRDMDGLPYIPGKTLTGILRKSAALAASVLAASGRDNARTTDWNEVLLSLFGGQTGEGRKRAKTGIGDAVFSDSLKRSILQHGELLPTLFIVQPGVRIDRETGRSGKDYLFTREEVRGGVTLYADVKINESLSPEEEQLLSDAVRATRGMGGQRHRGGGRCTITLETNAPPPDAAPAGYAPPNLTAIRSAATGVLELEFLLETLKPVVVKRASAGGVVQSETFIPGTQLLRYFVERISDNDAGFAQTLWTAVTKGEFSVGPFYPEVNGCVAYPAPPLEDVDAVFPNFPASPDAGVLYRTHSVVSDAQQRSGGFFTYQAIKPGLKFRGTLRISKSLWGAFKRASRLELARMVHASIGLSRKDEYGLARITCVGRTTSPVPAPDQHRDGRLAVYLASDVLVRSEKTLAFTSDIADFKKSLEEVLGAPLADDDARAHCVRRGRRESWHAVWVLPRPSFVCLQAGSVFFFKIDYGHVENPGRIDWDAVGNRLLYGIGDRVGEGYGRVFLNPRFDDATPRDVPGAPADRTPLDPEDREFFALLKKESLKTAFRKSCRRYIAEYVRHNRDPLLFFGNVGFQGAPSKSQVGILRELGATVAESGNVAPLTSWLDRNTTWHTAQRTWLREVATGTRDIWTIVEEENRRLLDNDLRDTLRIFTLSIFLDTLCEFIFDARGGGDGRQGQEALQ
ncbi:MAG: RAMP superfamily CRISPR-associated protein [Synergistaceae bacterium]|nr:RAMP superfamily CRISPR-associated protein [Synergistaceae bacterium]